MGKTKILKKRNGERFLSDSFQSRWTYFRLNQQFENVERERERENKSNKCDVKKKKLLGEIDKSNEASSE